MEVNEIHMVYSFSVKEQHSGESTVQHFWNFGGTI